MSELMRAEFKAQCGDEFESLKFEILSMLDSEICAVAPVFYYSIMSSYSMNIQQERIVRTKGVTKFVSWYFWMTIEIYFRTGRYLATEDIQNRLDSDLFNYLCKNLFRDFDFKREKSVHFLFKTIKTSKLPLINSIFPDTNIKIWRRKRELEFFRFEEMNKIKILLFLFIQEAQSYCPQVIYFRTNHNDPDQLHSFRKGLLINNRLTPAGKMTN